MARRSNTQLDFWNRVRVGENALDDCWEWVGGLSRVGYGQMTYEGRTHTAHRLAWEFMRGEIPGELFVLHKCDNPTCCNPWHLFLGTHQDNMDDMKKKKRAIGKKIKRLTDEEVLAVRAMYEAGVKGQIIADVFGVTTTCVSLITARITHPNL